MTGHPEAGALRAAADGERPDVAVHLDACPACQARSREQGAEARVAATAFAGSLPAVDVDAALARLGPRRRAEVVPLPVRAPVWRRSRAGRAAAAVIVLVLAAVLATPGGRATAAGLLERFRAERVTAVPVDFAAVDPAALEALAEVVEVGGLEQLQPPQPVADLAEAAVVSGVDAAPLDVSALPRSVEGELLILAQAPQTVRLDFADDPSLPEALRTAVLVVHVPGGVVQAVGGQEGMPAAVRGEAGTLEVDVEGGPSLAQVRDGLLSLPGLPPETVAALRSIEDWETTLPLPVPVGQIAWEETTVDGHPGLAFGDETGVGSALLWHDGEHFVGVGGTLPLSEARRMAEGG